jgi:uncharacterized protein (TIGR00159 family)
LKDFLLALSWRDVVDILVASALFWGAILWLRRTRALPAFLGLAILGAVYLGARQLGLQLTARIFQGFSAVLLVLVVVVFQEDLRRMLERIGSWGLRRRAPPRGTSAAAALVRSITRLIQTRTGALLVLPGREPLDRHLDGGLLLGGKLTEPLLLSLFDPSSPGHDGAVLVEGDKVARFALRLPLSSDQNQLKEMGTRHAAALGLSERCDALVIAVSEERGEVSVARAGVLTRLAGARELTAVLTAFQDEVTPDPGQQRSPWQLLVRQWRPALLAVSLSLLLWGLLGPGSTVVEVERSATVVLSNLPAEFTLESITPEQVAVVLRGTQRRVMLAPVEPLQVRVDAVLAQLGRRTFQLDPDQVDTPRGTEVVSVRPTSVKLSLRTGSAGGPKNP